MRTSGLLALALAPFRGSGEVVRRRPAFRGIAKRTLMNPSLAKHCPVLLLGALVAMMSETCWAQASGDAARAPALALTNPFCQLAPGDALRYVRDPSRQATLAQVLAKPPGEWSAFKPGPTTSFGFTADTFWLRLRLQVRFCGDH